MEVSHEDTIMGSWGSDEGTVRSSIRLHYNSSMPGSIIAYLHVLLLIIFMMTLEGMYNYLYCTYGNIFLVINNAPVQLFLIIMFWTLDLTSFKMQLLI